MEGDKQDGSWAQGLRYRTEPWGAAAAAAASSSGWAMPSSNSASATEGRIGAGCRIYKFSAIWSCLGVWLVISPHLLFSCISSSGLPPRSGRDTCKPSRSYSEESRELTLTYGCIRGIAEDVKAIPVIMTGHGDLHIIHVGHFGNRRAVASLGISMFSHRSSIARRSSRLTNVGQVGQWDPAGTLLLLVFAAVVLCRFVSLGVCGAPSTGPILSLASGRGDGATFDGGAGIDVSGSLKLSIGGPDTLGCRHSLRSQLHLFENGAVLALIPLTLLFGGGRVEERHARPDSPLESTVLAFLLGNLGQSCRGFRGDCAIIRLGF